MIIKIVTESKLTVVNFCMPKPDADLYMPLDLPPNQKNVENQDRPAGLLWAMGYGPPDRGPALAKPNLQYLQIMLYEDNHCNDIERRT